MSNSADELSTELIAAVLNRDVDAVDQALNAGANIDRSARYPPYKGSGADRSRTPLSWATAGWPFNDGGVNIAQVLLDRGADLETIDPDGYTALGRAISNANPWNYYIIELLLEAGASPVAPFPGGTMFEQACGVTRDNEVIGMLLGRGAQITLKARRCADEKQLKFLEEWAVASEGLGALEVKLFEAVRAGDVEAVSVLLDRGANLGAKDASGWTPLDYAMSKGDAVVGRLLKAAQLRLRKMSADNLALLLSVLRDDPAEMRSLLAICGRDARSRTGRTALKLAATHGCVAALRGLLADGAVLKVSTLPLTTPHYHEVCRLLENAASGLLPFVPTVSAQPRGGCELCHNIPERVGWSRDLGLDCEVKGEPIPAAVVHFELFDEGRLRKCPCCRTYYSFERDYDGAMQGGYESEELVLLSNEDAAEHLARTRLPSLRDLEELRALQVRDETRHS